MKYCTNCGHGMDDSTKFCTNCGFENINISTTSKNSSKNEEQFTSPKNIICNSCGEKVSSVDKICKYCGAPINTENSVDIASLEENIKRFSIKGSKRKSVLIITIAAITVIAAIAIFLTTTSGHLKRASVVASFGSYDHAKQIVDNINSNDSYVDLYKNYYGMMTYVDEMTSCSPETFDEKYSQAMYCSTQISNMFTALKDSEQVKYNNILEAINNYSDKHKIIYNTKENLTAMSEVSEQIEYFKSGNTYSPSKICEKAQQWSQKLNDANSAYIELLPDEELPHYTTVRSEITKMINDMKNSKYYNKTNVYYKVYENNYTNPYTETEINSILEKMTDKIRGEFRDKVEHVL